MPPQDVINVNANQTVLDLKPEGLSPKAMPETEPVAQAASMTEAEKKEIQAAEVAEAAGDSQSKPSF
jgi:hypothetical protein